MNWKMWGQSPCLLDNVNNNTISWETLATILSEHFLFSPVLSFRRTLLSSFSLSAASTEEKDVNAVFRVPES